MKNKIKYGLKEYFRPTPQKVEAFLLWMKGILAIPAVMTAADGSWKITVIIMFAGFVIDQTCKFIGEHPEILAVEEAEVAIKDKVEEAAAEVKHEIETQDDIS